jgi:hypothetical protein
MSLVFRKRGMGRCSLQRQAENPLGYIGAQLNLTNNNAGHRVGERLHLDWLDPLPALLVSWRLRHHGAGSEAPLPHVEPLRRHASADWRSLGG